MVFSAVMLFWFAATMASAADMERQHVPTATGDLRSRASQHRRHGASHGAKHVASTGLILGAGNGHAGRSLLQSASSPRCRKLLQPLATATDEHHPLTTPLAEAPEQQYQATEQQVQVLQQFPGLYVGGGEHSNLSMDSLALQYGNGNMSQSGGNAANITVGNSNSSSSLISVSSMKGAEDDDKLGHGFPQFYLQQHPGQVLPSTEPNLGHLNVTVGTNTTITNTTVDGVAPATVHASNGSQTDQVLRRRVLKAPGNF
eukprot:gene4306-4558_t